MFKKLAKTSFFLTGICGLSDLRTGNRAGFFGGQRRPSISLYEAAASEPNGDQLTAEILERFGDERGTFKRTYDDRFPEFDASILSFMRERFSSTERLTVHDAGVSDGRTASSFFASVTSIYPDTVYYASDYGNMIKIVNAWGGAVAFSENGDVLEVMWPPFVHNTSKRELWKSYPLNFLHEEIAMRLLVPYTRWRLNSGKARSISLCCPCALKLAAQDPRFILMTHDLLSPFSGPGDLHAVRAMNIVHEGYFSDEQMTGIASHILRSLREGGIFIVGRNEGPGSPVSGGIYTKVGRHFEVAWQSGGQAPECEPLILRAG